MFSADNAKIIEFLKEFRRQVLWVGKKPPNTILRSAYLNGVSKVAMAGLASRMQDSKLHVISCRGENEKHIVSEWVLSHNDQLFSIEGPATSKSVHAHLFERAHHKNPSIAMNSHIIEQIKDPTPLLQMLTLKSDVMLDVMRKFERVWAVKIDAVHLDEQTMPASSVMPRSRI
jgi:hypothetical protein